MSAQPEGLLTIAYGRPKYIRMAQALALSYRRYKPRRPFAVVTDETNAPALSRYFDEIILAKPEFGAGVVQKLYADIYSPFSKTLFVDSDCLFYKHPDGLWDLYAHGPFSMRGWRYLTGNTDYEKRTPYKWVQDTSQFLKLNNIQRLAHFNGGVFYFDHSDTAVKLFSISRSLYERRAELGFVAFKGAPINDEPAMAVAMEKCGISMDPWDSVRGMETAIGMRKAWTVNVLEGQSRFFKDDSKRIPALIHYNVNAQDGVVYNRDVYRLLYEAHPFRPFLVIRAVLMTCVPAFYRRVLQLAPELPSRLRREARTRIFPVRRTRLLNPS
jgi:hypothetical protein